MMTSLHRVLLAILVVGNAVAFAGVDPVTKLVTAVLVCVLMVDLRSVPAVPKLFRAAALLFLGLAIIQLAPLPEILRRVIQPGFADVMASGWSSLSLAPWSSIKTIASLVVTVGIAIAAARMAATRTGLPILLGYLAVTCGVLAVLGLAGESGAPEKVLLVRANVGGGDVYGPFVNSNHFAAAIELSLPAALVLLVAAFRNLPQPGAVRQRAAVLALASGVAVIVAVAAVLRSSSRGGILFLAAALLLTVPWWVRPTGGRRWPWFAGAVVLLAAAATLAWTRLPELRDSFSAMLMVEGVEGNTRWDLWKGTVGSFTRSPVVGSGLGSYRHVIGLDKPATGTAVLEQAHNDWLEWASTTGVIGITVLAMILAGLVLLLLPRRVRRLRFELRYPLAGAVVALTATALHESVGFGLQTPLNRYLLAVWIGLVWGVRNRVEAAKARGSGAAGNGQRKVVVRPKPLDSPAGHEHEQEQEHSRGNTHERDDGGQR